jgi:hypothetical protein
MCTEGNMEAMWQRGDDAKRQEEGNESKRQGFKEATKQRNK